MQFEQELIQNGFTWHTPEGGPPRLRTLIYEDQWVDGYPHNYRMFLEVSEMCGMWSFDFFGIDSDGTKHAMGIASTESPKILGVLSLINALRYLHQTPQGVPA
jgi:hypothetical protein